MDRINKLVALLVISLSTLTIVGAGLAYAPQAAAAGDPLFGICTGSGSGKSAACTEEEETIGGTGGVVLKAANLVAIVAGIAAVVMIMLGSYHYITSNGDSGKISSAKNTIIFAIVGIVVIALARTIVGYVIGRVAG